MRFALFCDGAYSPTVAATVGVHVPIINAEVEAVREAVVVVVFRSRTPIVAIVTSIVER